MHELQLRAVASARSLFPLFGEGKQTPKGEPVRCTSLIGIAMWAVESRAARPVFQYLHHVNSASAELLGVHSQINLLLLSNEAVIPPLLGLYAGSDAVKFWLLGPFFLLPPALARCASCSAIRTFSS